MSLHIIKKLDNVIPVQPILDAMKEQPVQLPGFALRIRALRLARGWTQQELAYACGWVHQTRILKYEQGREPSHADLDTLARALDTTTVFLLMGEQAVPVATGPSLPLLDWTDMRRQHHIQTAIPFWPVQSGPRSFLVTLPDNKYAPIFPKGALLLIDPQKKPATGSYVIVETAPTTFEIYRVAKNQQLKRLRANLPPPPKVLLPTALIGVVCAHAVSYP